MSYISSIVFIIRKFLQYTFIKTRRQKHNIIVSKNSSIDLSSKLTNNIVIGNNVIIGAHTRLENIEVGEGSHIEWGVICMGYGHGKIIIGKNSYIGVNNVLDWSDNIQIGDYVHIAGPSTGLWTHTSVEQVLSGHELSNKNKRKTSPIYIGDRVYMGGNCTVYPGIKIEHDCVILPNSVVNKNIAAYSMYGGAPAKFIKKIEMHEI